MRRIILTESDHIAPFNEPARDLRVQNKPLWLWHRDLLVKYATEEREYPDWQTAASNELERVESLVHRDNLFFNAALIEEFIGRARAGARPVRLAFSVDDPAIATHVTPLTHSLQRQDDLLLADVWYLPEGLLGASQPSPLIVETEPLERGYYHVPPYMATEVGDLTYQLPRKAFAVIESWVHLFITDILFGVFARGVVIEHRVNVDWIYKLKIMLRSLVEQKHVHSNSEMVRIGRNVTIDSSAVIHGPTTIGDNVTIGAGAVIDNCIIGSNVNVSQGCQLMLSVVSDGCFLPFRASLFMTTMMENTMVAQNSCLQLCVIGRDSFVGAGTTFTDFNVLPTPLRTRSRSGQLEETNLLVLGGCVGHHCRIAAGLTIYPARTIESDVVLLGSNQRSFITKNVAYEDSDYKPQGDRLSYPRLYPRSG
jgi:carbonic anhydrase/acetyltransferase-like protein (isoleucine patch superfamily)